MAQPVLMKLILYNLDILGGLKHEQTLYTEGIYLAIDQRSYQPISRFWNGNSRESVLKCIEQTWALIDELLRSYQCILSASVPKGGAHHTSAIQVHLKELKDRHETVMNGFDMLKTFVRYKSDPSFQVRISLCQADWLKLQTTVAQVQTLVPANG
jgi:hypothetical protein